MTSRLGYVFRPARMRGCDRLVIRAKVIEKPASAIAISSDSLDESVGSPPSQVIHFGDIPTVIPSTYVVALVFLLLLLVISSDALVVETTLVASPGLFFEAPRFLDGTTISGSLLLLPLSVGGVGNSGQSIIICVSYCYCYLPRPGSSNGLRFLSTLGGFSFWLSSKHSHLIGPLILSSVSEFSSFVFLSKFHNLGVGLLFAGRLSGLCECELELEIVCERELGARAGAYVVEVV
ncbi:hypothetical protein Tco_1082842 [Tanacetum coccineum]|uniref:Uncharacterized protein n=1 Tax=Tanacetum coccineum TaxID=301880 RepID=A0ABQ5I3R4_9ASTR